MNRKRGNRITGMAAGILIFLLGITVLLSCDQKITPTSDETVSTETTQTETTALPSAESTEGGKEESLTETSEPKTEASETEPAVIEPGDPIAAYRVYMEVLQQERDGIARWDPDGSSADAGGNALNVALCDITGDSAPELLYLSAKEEEKKKTQSAALRILSLTEGRAAELLNLEEIGHPDESPYYCFFTVSGSRTLYAYMGSADESGTDTWYWFETQADGALQRRELAMKRPASASESGCFYMGESCSQEKYQNLINLLLTGTENILLSSPQDVFSERFHGTETTAEHYGMSVDQAVSFLRSELSAEVPEADDFESVLRDFLLTERFLVSQEKYYTEEGSTELLFGLHDMNADGTPELLIQNGSPLYAELTDHIYGFEGGTFRYLGDAGFRECELWTAPGSAYPGVFCTAGHSGFITDVYYGMQEDGTVQSEIIATYEDTSYKVQTHDEERVTNDQALYDTWLMMRPLEGREAVWVQMYSRSWIRENGIDAFLQEALPPSS